MGIFDKIKSAIWGDENEVAPEARSTGDFPSNPTLTTGIAPEVATATPAANPTPSDIAASGAKPVSKPAEIQAAPRPAASLTEIDVATQLDRAASVKGQDLNWRTSIVDLMKVVGMEASLQERKDLARELNYTGDTSDTATMNMWLHKQLMRKLAENGGKVPAEYLD
jgi:hypothetical protein